MEWAYGITTVPSRICDLLPKTIDSLKRAGFDRPRLFVDGASSGYEHFNLPVTYHDQPLKTVGNFMLGLWELYVRQPTIDRYAMFQDDFITYPGLRDYLTNVPYPDKGYLNLYTFPCNQPNVVRTLRDNEGRVRYPDLSPDQQGFYEADQFGKGAVALVFNRDAVFTLLSSGHMVSKPTCPWRGEKALDGGIVTAMNLAGYREYVHNPSLVQHIGDISSMGNSQHQKAESFRGEDYDVRQLIQAR